MGTEDMKLKIVQSNIFTSSADAIVNPVNCKGTMGKGLAADFKQKFPRNFETYKKSCEEDWLKPGRILTFSEEGKVIYNFPTKDDWKKPAEYIFIELGLNALVIECLRSKIKSISLPPLGCGLGGLSFGKVMVQVVEHKW